MLLLQIHLTQADIDFVNSYGWVAAEQGIPRVRAYSATRGLGLGSAQKWEAGFLAHYTVVASIETNDLDEAFDAGNGHGRAKVLRSPIARAHSASVGDLLVDEAGRIFMVANVGFTLVGVD